MVNLAHMLSIIVTAQGGKHEVRAYIGGQTGMHVPLALYDTHEKALTLLHSLRLHLGRGRKQIGFEELSKEIS